MRKKNDIQASVPESASSGYEYENENENENRQENEYGPLLEMADRTGLIGVWTKRAYLGTNEWIDYLRQADGEIKILCYSMAFLPEHPDFAEVINEKVSEGHRVRILFGNPKGAYINARTVEMRTEGLISARIHTSVTRIQAIENENVEYRFFDEPLYASIYEFGSTMLVTPQLYGKRSACAPLLMFQKMDGGLYDSYDEYFEEVWRNAEGEPEEGAEEDYEEYAEIEEIEEAVPEEPEGDLEIEN